ncbi:hypothetical protein [Roseivivax isoporae]|nr:hypothetical protein [Roseivivax isoporae]
MQHKLHHPSENIPMRSALCRIARSATGASAAICLLLGPFAGEALGREEMTARIVREALDLCHSYVADGSPSMTHVEVEGPLTISLISEGTTHTCYVGALDASGQGATPTWGEAREAARTWIEVLGESQFSGDGGMTVVTTCSGAGTALIASVGAYPVLQSNEPLADVPLASRPFFALVQSTDQPCNSDATP